MLAIISVGIANLLILQRVVILWEHRPVRLFSSTTLLHVMLSHTVLPSYCAFSAITDWRGLADRRHVVR